MLDLATAHTRVSNLCQPALDPVLNDAEIDTILVQTAYGSIWLPNTPYTEGQFVVPTVPLGRIYRCVLAGTSDTAVAPQWLIAPPYTGPVNPYAGRWWGMGIVPTISSVISTPWFWGLADGTAAWRDYGPFIGEIYNVRKAVYECYMLKAAKASNRVDSTVAGGVSARESQTAAQCMAMARHYQPPGLF